MYICLCNGVSDKVVRKLVRQYHPHTMQQLRQLIPIGSGCGKCQPEIRKILMEERAHFLKTNDIT